MLTKVEVFAAGPAPVLTWGGFAASDDPVQIRSIDGLGPVKAEIITTPSGVSRGESFQGSSTSKRNIVLSLGLNPNWQTQTMSSLRQLLYRYFMTQEWVKLRFYSDELPTTDIEGYVESFEPNMFAQDPEIQVSIINPKPDFIEIDANIYKGVVDDGSNQLEVSYEGSVSTGIELRVDRTVTLPAYTGLIAILVENYRGIKSITVDPVSVNTIQSYKMSSVAGQKRVQTEILADGTITNLLKLKYGDWPELLPGTNLVSVSALVPGQSWTLAYFSRFGGL